MHSTEAKRSTIIGALALFAAIFAVAAPARAQQDMLQLIAPQEEYTLGRFTYKPPKVDGWRQIERKENSVSFIYAEEPEPGKIDTKFGVTLEAHDIPAEAGVTTAMALAQMSLQQVSEQEKKILVAASPVEAVASRDDLYTYRLLVKSPKPEMPDSYEVYYVAMAPDKSQYIVVQCVTKTPEYGNELYFNQFYGSLPSLKYTGPAAGGDAKPAAQAPKAAETPKPADKPASH